MLNDSILDPLRNYPAAKRNLRCNELSDPTLFIFPCLRAVKTDRGAIVTRKLMDGAHRFAELWEGQLKLIMFPADQASDNLDNFEFVSNAASDPIEILVVPYERSRIAEVLRGPAIALVGADHLLASVSRICYENQITSVYGTEYTLRTRWQIVRSNTANPIIRTRRYIWEWNLERRHRRAISYSVGVQCNGTPTYEAYRKRCRLPFLFFDNRIDESMLISHEALEKRLAQLADGNPLRLAFSGRLIRMKGADHLPKLSYALRKRGVDCYLSIFGDGTLAEPMRREVDRLGLGDHVGFHGSLDFATELVPTISTDVDLFVCPHRQGDPSCTYVETFACGVPMVGYDNEAFDGILKIAKVGREVPMDDINALADVIADLDHDRKSIASMAQHARRFAADHTFGRGIKRRIEHFRECLDRTNSQCKRASNSNSPVATNHHWADSS